VLAGAVHIADQAFVRHAASGARGRGRIVWARPRSLTAVEVGHQGDIALVRKTAGDLLAAPVVTGHVMDDDNPPERALPEGLCKVGLDLIAAMSGDGDRFSFHVVAHGPEAIAATSVPLLPGSRDRRPIRLVCRHLLRDRDPLRT